MFNGNTWDNPKQINRKIVPDDITTNCSTCTATLYAFMPKCNSCSHCAICKYQDDYNKLLRSINDTYNVFENSKEIFTLELGCKYYNSNLVTTIGGSYIYNGPDPEIHLDPKYLNPCGKDIECGTAVRGTPGTVITCAKGDNSIINKDIKAIT